MEWVVPAKLGFSSFANCYEENGDVLESEGTAINKSESENKWEGYQKVDKTTGHYKSHTV